MNHRTSFRRRRGLVLVTLILLATGPRAALALTGDTTQPIHIDANTADYDDKTGVSIYRGNVRLIQGSMVLTGDKITITAPGQKLQKIVAEGSKDRLSTFKMLRDDGEAVYAEAEFMEYDLGKNQILLLRHAWVEQGGNKIASDRILYDTVKETVDAGDVTQGSRVKMIITPGSGGSEQ